MPAASRGTDRTWPLFIGGFIGPFGAQLVSTMLPELSADLSVTVEVASTALTAYLVPFAALMLVSGTLAERWGRRSTVRTAYLVYFLASVACLAAPTFETFLLGRVLQGASNAFTTPVLVGAITDLVPTQRLGRSLGLFGSLQALGQAMSPLAGGLAASVHWRWAFVVCAVVAGVLFFLPPQNPASPTAAPQAPTTPTDGQAASQWKALANRRLALACVVAGLAYLSTTGIILLVALFARVQFGLSPSAAGLVVASFGLAGLLTGRRTGALLDRFGVLPVGAAAHALVAGACLVVALTAGLSVTMGVAITVVAVAVGGVGGTASRSAAQTLAVTSAPTNRAGASSVMLACQFGSAAVAPLMLIPVFTSASPSFALFVAAVPALLAAGLLLFVRRVRPPAG